MTTTRGSAVKHAVISATDFSSLSKDENTLYFVGGSTGVSLYKGATQVAGSFKVLQSSPSDTTGMLEGMLYLAPNGKFYYRSGSTLSIAFDFVTSTASDGASNATQVPSVSAMYSAISAEIASYMSGTFHSSILSPVADITALKAKTGMQDKDIVFVESINSLFSYDAQSSATADDTLVVSPTGGVGRWLKTRADITYNSSDFQWGSGGLELKGAAPLVVGALPVASSSTVGRLYVLTSDNKMYLGTSDTSGAEPVYDFAVIAGGASGGVSQTLINTVSSNPTVTSSNNGETYFNTSTGRTYVVESGSLVQKTYSKDDVDGLVSWYSISNS